MLLLKHGAYNCCRDYISMRYGRSSPNLDSSVCSVLSPCSMTSRVARLIGVWPWVPTAPSFPAVLLSVVEAQLLPSHSRDLSFLPPEGSRQSACICSKTQWVVLQLLQAEHTRALTGLGYTSWQIAGKQLFSAEIRTVLVKPGCLGKLHRNQDDNLKNLIQTEI